MSNRDNYAFDVFISYSHKDEGWVTKWFLPRLKQAGLRVSIDCETFEVGAPIVVNIENSVVMSRKTVLVLTPDYINSQWATFESIVVQTLDPSARARRIIPLLLIYCELPLRLRVLTYIDFRLEQQQDDQLQRMLQQIRGCEVVKVSNGLTSALSDLSSHNLEERIKAAKWLGVARKRSAIPKLSQRLAEEVDPEARYWIALALGDIGGEEAKCALFDFAEKLGNNMDAFAQLAINDALVTADRTKNLRCKGGDKNGTHQI